MLGNYHNQGYPYCTSRKLCRGVMTLWKKIFGMFSIHLHQQGDFIGIITTPVGLQVEDHVEELSQSEGNYLE